MASRVVILHDWACLCNLVSPWYFPCMTPSGSSHESATFPERRTTKGSLSLSLCQQSVPSIPFLSRWCALFWSPTPSSKCGHNNPSKLSELQCKAAVVRRTSGTVRLKCKCSTPNYVKTTCAIRWLQRFYIARLTENHFQAQSYYMVHYQAE